jgi:hypothetical protein
MACNLIGVKEGDPTVYPRVDALSANANPLLCSFVRIWPKVVLPKAYEADQSPEPSYGTGAITRYVEINPMPKAGGKWNTFEITARGRDITVVLNGNKTAELRNGMFDEGWIALQHGAGAIRELLRAARGPAPRQRQCQRTEPAKLLAVFCGEHELAANRLSSQFG